MLNWEFGPLAVLAGPIRRAMGLWAWAQWTCDVDWIFNHEFEVAEACMEQIEHPKALKGPNQY